MRVLIDGVGVGVAIVFISILAKFNKIENDMLDDIVMIVLFSISPELCVCVRGGNA